MSEHQVKLFEGALPSVIALMLVEPKVFDGSFEHASLKFTRHDLVFLEVLVDGTAVSSHPLKFENGNSLNFYVEFLKRSNRFYNFLSASTISQQDYNDSNFLHLINLKHEGFKHGQCVINLKFASELQQKLFLIVLPVYEKALRFDAYLNTSLV